MWKRAVALDETIEFLNELLDLDPVAVRALVEQRVSCNKALAEHPTVQTWSPPSANGVNYVGLLGILNGLFGVDDAGGGPITAVFTDDSITLQKFVRSQHIE